MCKWRFSVRRILRKLTPTGLDGNMCRDVACCHDEDGETCHQRQDVLRAMFGNRSILEKG